MKKAEPSNKTSGTTAPKYIVIDTNVLLRLIVLDFGTKEPIGIPSLAKRAGSLIVLAPNQEDEFWRNASVVLAEHTKRWAQIAQNARRLVSDLMLNLRAAQSLGILNPDQIDVLKSLGPAKQRLEGVEERDIQWHEFEAFAEKNLDVLKRMTASVKYDAKKVRAQAEERVALSNPPCRDKKPRPLGDCMIWELVLTLLKRKSGDCWFATTDSDFSDENNIHALNRLLSRDVDRCGGNLVFIHEDRDLGLSPGSQFRILTRLVDTLPKEITEQWRSFIQALSLIVPINSWIQVEEALQQLPYTEREVFRLRTGIGDGYDYTPTEIARIFKIPVESVGEIQKATEDFFIRHLSKGN